MNDMPKHSLAYLASPYRLYPAGHEQAYADICAIAAQLLKAGVKVFCPIAHGHGIALHGEIDPDDMAVWHELNKAIMDRCDVLIVAHMKGWDVSNGIYEETKHFEQAGKTIFDLDVKTLLLKRRQA